MNLSKAALFLTIILRKKYYSIISQRSQAFHLSDFAHVHNIRKMSESNYLNLLLPPNEDGLKVAAHLLISGDIVAFPTETVYGLGANALNSDAVQSVFAAKGRPLTDPLIVHILNFSSALPLISLSEEEKKVFESLTKEFWPGPLTLIVRSSHLIPPAVTARTGFVGVRAPAHFLARRLLEECGLPIAAPSANRFGHVSPTKASHVLADLGCKGVHVLNGEEENTTEGQSCQFGIESTVLKVDGASRTLSIFRQGAVTQYQIEKSLEQAGLSSSWTVAVVSRTVAMQSVEVSSTEVLKAEPESAVVGQEAPGQAVTHYSPDVPCVMVRKVSFLDTADGQTAEDVEPSNSLTISSQDLLDGCVVIDFGGALTSISIESLAYRDLSPSGQSKEAARRLFDYLRWAESVPGAKRVLVASIPSAEPSTEERSSEELDLSLGLADRVFRAASGVNVEIRIQR